jgi:hypothetical protein
MKFRIRDRTDGLKEFNIRSPGVRSTPKLSEFDTRYLLYMGRGSKTPDF